MPKRPFARTRAKPRAPTALVDRISDSIRRLKSASIEIRKKRPNIMNTGEQYIREADYAKDREEIKQRRLRALELIGQRSHPNGKMAKRILDRYQQFKKGRKLNGP